MVVLRSSHQRLSAAPIAGRPQDGASHAAAQTIARLPADLQPPPRLLETLGRRLQATDDHQACGEIACMQQLVSRYICKRRHCAHQGMIACVYHKHSCILQVSTNLKRCRNGL